MMSKNIDVLAAEKAPDSLRIVNWRLLFRTVIKSGLLLGRKVQAMGQSVYAEANKLVVEAKADLDKNENTKEGAPHAGGSN